MNEAEIIEMVARVRTELSKSERPEIPWTGSARVSAGESLARYFDHTLLKPEATADQYRALCREAAELGTRSVCVPPDRVALCHGELAATPVEVCTVIGFPLGYHSAHAKVAEVERAGEAGATEFDMVIPVGRLRDGDFHAVYDDVRAVVAAAGSHIVKVILETALLSDEEKVAAGTAALHAGAAILKTSTGFASGGATEADLVLLRTICGAERGVKAAGGVRTYKFAAACIATGADRIGASATAAILAEARGAKPQSHDTGGGGY